ncbi:diguanylate cyclase domain-containing protein [Ectothiorhodospira lacustris]|uniref:diguanylate cyclase domain-containing protein n=1 Tax=Ectothiorhodospira lacustris TaxID=2899127 RepID=UPI001EE7B9B2|nr:diguanylate cyclase [Ectothiorhodospira lacustris]MCG5510018.1 diguanylate cyclase [Ectothiorhodospira lacustris]MCG5521764.1 diguanylate cyclase [Ectothiorhodospira lacustris]
MLNEVKATVLIVDDQPANIHVLANLLSSEYRLLTATRAEKALILAGREPAPDLILLDVLMPDMDGYELCYRLKEDARTRHIPVIFVTALDHDVNEEKGFNLGAADYISKPFNPAIVRARVRNHINYKLKADRLERISLQDSLTELPNRRHFDQKLAEEWSRLSRHVPSCLSLLMIDVDCFKSYNDHYGHGAGDVVLRRVAQVLKDSIARPSDFVARYGGEEFVALLPDTDAQGARHVGECMVAAVRDLKLPHEYSGVSPCLTVSVGIATRAAPAPLPSAEALKQAADQALYRAKAHGRDRVME